MFFYFFVLLSITQIGLSESHNPRIINGRIIEESVFAETMRINMFFENGLRAACTASAVSDNTLITAAHCVKDGSSSLKNVKVISGEATGAVSIEWRAQPKYSTLSTSYDVALVVFPDDTFKTWYTVADQPPAIGDKFIIIGYGKTNFNSSTIDHLKRYGSNTLTKVGQRLNFLGSATTSATESATGQRVSNDVGDSGGPMILNDRLIGISSSIGSSLTAGGLVSCFYENLLYAENLSFLKTAEQFGAKVSGL